MATLNLGILAHVDAGKTTLTERLLHAAGVIDEIGRVDDGTTQTDSLALERQRGITIKSAVVSFVVDGVTINLIDTPGHPDFIAEVERVLGVLDGAVLVVSAVEGVQSQTLLLFRALRRFGVPTIVFVNKIDRVGADDRRVLDADRATASPRTSWRWARRADVGTRRAGVTAHDLDDPVFAAAATEVLAANDDAILRRYLDGTPIAAGRLRRALAEQTARLHVLPGVLRRRADRRRRRRPPARDPDAAAVRRRRRRRARRRERCSRSSADRAGEKIAFVRMFAGTLRTRDRVRLGADRPTSTTVTAIDVFDRGTTQRRPATHAGEIAKVHGLSTRTHRRHVRPDRPHRRPARLRPADAGDGDRAPRTAARSGPCSTRSADLAEQDPLINLRQDDTRQELFLSLYGEVQKEIVAQTLEGDYGLDIEFRPTTPVCIERPNGAGAAVELLPPRPVAGAPVPRHGRPGDRAPAARLGRDVRARRRRQVDPDPRLRQRRRVPRASCSAPSATRCARASTAGRSPTAAWS